MPVLPSSYIGTWYYFTDNNGEIQIFESYKESQLQDLKAKPLLQGDIGTHVLDVGGIQWQTDITTPVIIFENAFGSQGVTSAFSLLKKNFGVLQKPIPQDYNDPPKYLLKSGKISVKESGVTCDMSFVSTEGGIFTPEFRLNPQMDFIGRVARFYDTQFIVSANTSATYQVVDGEINIAVDIKDNYFINTGQSPFFGVQGYRVTGKIKVLALPNDRNLTIVPQDPGDFRVHGYSATALKIGNESFNFGEANLNSRVERSITPDAITTLSIDFESYVRFTTNIEATS